MSLIGTKQTSRRPARMSASKGNADIAKSYERSRFMSTRPNMQLCLIFDV
jgi:hypothetical protein